MRSQRVASSCFSLLLAMAALLFSNANAAMTGAGNGLPEIGKFKTARCVVAPYKAIDGTSIVPIESDSILVLIFFFAIV